jgi:hypothetical protein
MPPRSDLRWKQRLARKKSLTEAASNELKAAFNLDSFKKHGTIHWIPNIYTDNNGDFEFKIPILEQEKILLNIQGIDIDGNPYYQNKIVNVKE